MADLSVCDAVFMMLDYLCHRRYRRYFFCFFFTTIVILSITAYLTYIKLIAMDARIHGSEAQPYDTTEKDEILRVLHLDLKGAPPKISYLIDLIPRLISVGVNGLLIEYEDMFPYEGILQNITSKSPYSKQDIERFVRYCNEENIEVIPLVQTFGHMEYILKLQEFRFLREDMRDPRTICPSNARTMKTIKEMIQQIITLHPYSKKIHIGCDEVIAINMCPLCAKTGKSSWSTFHSHVREIASFIQITYNRQIRVLIWDDMLRFRDHDSIETSNLHHYVDIVIWDYTAGLEIQIRNQIWHKYVKIFKRIWVAGAFKGADGPKSMLPKMQTRFENHKSWLQFIEFKAPPTKIVGFISTGWSRYDHFASLCELLPASIPSLILNLLKVSNALSSSRRDVENEYNTFLQCYRYGNTIMSGFDIRRIYNLSHVHHCLFREARLITSILEIDHLQDKIDKMYDTLYENSGWISEYHLKSNMLNTRIVDDHFRANAYEQIRSSFYTIYPILNNELKRFFHNNTVVEWLETHVEPFARKLQTLKCVLDNATMTNIWPRRHP